MTVALAVEFVIGASGSLLAYALGYRRGCAWATRQIGDALAIGRRLGAAGETTGTQCSRCLRDVRVCLCEADLDAGRIIS